LSIPGAARTSYYAVNGIGYTFGHKKDRTREGLLWMADGSAVTRSLRDSFARSGFFDVPFCFR
jgi:hypothetical protein